MGNIFRPNTDYTLATQVAGDNGKVAFIPSFKAVDGSGNAVGGTSYTLASNITLAGSATGTPVTGIQGGSYIWAYQFGGTTPSLVLESLGPDAVNYQTIATVTASGTTGVVIGNNATVRLRNNTANSITGLSSNLT